MGVCLKRLWSEGLSRKPSEIEDFWGAKTLQVFALRAVTYIFYTAGLGLAC